MSDHSLPLRFIGVTAALAVALLLAACGSEDSEAPSASPSATDPRSYVGPVEGTSALVGVVVDGTRALAYVCDGVPGDPEGTTPTIQAWFNTASDGSSVDADTADGRLRLQLTATALSGTLTLPDGRQLQLSGQPVEGDAGLYRAEAEGDGTTAVGGWILAADGQQRGGVGGTDAKGTTISGTRTLVLTQPTFTPQGLATARIQRVGITPIPIP